MNRHWRKARAVLAAPFLSPVGLLLWAARLSSVLVALHLLGARSDTAVLSGSLRDPVGMFLGVSYTLTYFVCAAFTPPLLAAAAISTVVAWLRSLLRSFQAGDAGDVCSGPGMAAAVSPSTGWTRLRDRLARSSQVFLLGVIVACGVEVLVDWNSTFFEIGVLRDRVRERGVSYVSMLARSAASALRTGNKGMLTRLTDGIYDDADVVFVRFTDSAGEVRFERLEPEFAAKFSIERGAGFDDYYAKLLRRDIDGVLHDPVGQQQRMAMSRYRDIAERWSDLMTEVGNRVSTPVPAKSCSALVLYQQALRTAEHTRDDAVTWAFGVVQDEDGGAPVGAVLVGFNMARTNAAIRTKYLKGLGMVIFFVGLILVQNMAGRRDKLRLLDLEQRNALARAAIREALPPAVEAFGLRAAGALEQSAVHVDGMTAEVVKDGSGIWLLLVDPDGEGVDAAAVALHVRAVFRSRRENEAPVDLEGEVRVLGAASQDMPLSRPLGLIVAHVGGDGAVQALVGPVGDLRLLSAQSAARLRGEPGPDAPRGVVGPLTRQSGQLGSGDALLVVCGGIAEGDVQVDVESVAGFILRSSPRSAVEVLVDAVTWARGNTPGRDTRDIVIGAVQRAAAS